MNRKHVRKTPAEEEKDTFKGSWLDPFTAAVFYYSSGLYVFYLKSVLSCITSGRLFTYSIN